MSFLEDIFGLVCASTNVWAPGGVLLPFCQRCTGLYVGAVVALAAYLWLRPSKTWSLVLLHGSLLVGMIPFGYQWVEQDGLVRTTTGGLFAFGLLYFLLLPLWRLVGSRVVSMRAVLALLAATVCLVFASLPIANALAWIGFLGLLLYAVLLASNAVLVPFELWRAFRYQRAG